MKSFLERAFPELSMELATVSSVEEMIEIIKENSNIVDVSLIKTFVTRYEIPEALTLITDYEESIDEICQVSIRSLLGTRIGPESHRSCQTIEFVVHWNPDEKMLNDIRRLLEKAFQDLNKRINIEIFKINSIVIICYAPRHLMDVLFLRAQDNLTLLIKEFNLIRLTIGHHCVYDQRVADKVNFYLSTL